MNMLKDKCKHYKRWLYPVCNECKKIYPCHRCHNNIELHEMDRNNIKLMKCDYCKCIQKNGEYCINPECLKFKHYNYCGKCGLWCDRERVLFHCDKCNICRNGSKYLYKHCDKCNICFKKSYFNEHNCKLNMMGVNCSICLDNCWDSQENLTVIKCGHAFHISCLNTWLQNHWNCPLCKKSVSNLELLWQKMSEMMEQTVMPDEYKDWKSEIICYDCNKKSVTNYHFVYHKCSHCNSWNTSVDNILKNE